MGGRVGLDYAAVRTVAEIIDMNLDDRALGLLQVVEAERIRAWGEDEKRREAMRKSSTWERPPDDQPTGQSAFRKIKYGTQPSDDPSSTVIVS